MDKGFVVKIEDKYAYIEMVLNSSCTNCANKGICATDDKPALLKIPNKYDLVAGDRVDIELTTGTKLTSGFLLFIFPILLMIIGYYVGYIVEPSDGAGMIGSLFGLTSGVIILIGINRKVTKNGIFLPKYVKKIP
ncbi:MAG: SoxR reducing system RseC family protein [Candidatus Delongbacteria bacterium]|jgi:positive regulator of sigma E activity|nr:SoxR reducing system RseC family protein [Candidatus Delongbacteria bacterium]